MKRILFIFFSSLVLNSYSQETLRELLPSTGKRIGNFIPKKWIMVDTATGDFNNDGIQDVAIVLIDSINEKLIGDINRSLVVLEGTNNGLKLSEICDSAVLCFSCGGVHGDPFEGIRFDKNVLSVFHYGGSAWKWSLTHKFQFRRGKWVLIGETSNYWWTLEQCDKLDDFAGTKYRDVNYLTGQLEEKEISDNCKLIRHKKGKQKIKPLLTLNKFIIAN